MCVLSKLTSTTWVHQLKFFQFPAAFFVNSSRASGLWDLSPLNPSPPEEYDPQTLKKRKNRLLNQVDLSSFVRHAAPNKRFILSNFCFVPAPMTILSWNLCKMHNNYITPVHSKTKLFIAPCYNVLCSPKIENFKFRFYNDNYQEYCETA